MNICFHKDERYRDLWAHLVLTYDIDLVYEVGCMMSEGTDKWVPVMSYADVPGPRVFLSSQDAKLTPGTIALVDYSVPQDATLIFGLDDVHNSFEVNPGEPLIYLTTPHHTPLHAVQAATVALHLLSP